MRRAYTMIEILVSTLLTLLLLFAVVTIFAAVSRSINDSRATLEMSDRLRTASLRLQDDLGGLTVLTIPPRRPEQEEGYFEYMERSVGAVATNIDTGGPDSTVGDCDDILMFTTRSPKNPFIGRFGTGTIESHVAEVAWFVRGRTLYRRLLLVAPHVTPSGNAAGFYAANDISVRNENGTLIANRLGDLTKPENRYAHQSGGFPFAANWGPLGLPTLYECSAPGWIAGGSIAPPALTPRGSFDAWINPHPWNEVDAETGNLTSYNGSRVAEDVILTNVIGFDVKVWDPGAPVYTRDIVVENPPGVFKTITVALMPGDPGYVVGGMPADFGAYVDLGFAPAYPNTVEPKSHFHHTGFGLVRVYDTWSFHYEHDEQRIDVNGDGVISADEHFGDQDGDGIFDEGTNGFDDDGNGVVDDVAEMEAPAPYPVPLRGIQVKIRTFEPDSRQVREVTIIQDLIPK